MIIEYHRPDSIEKALALLGRKNPVTVPLGGGTILNAPLEDEIAVVDLQNLGLNRIEPRGSFLDVGATVLLQDLLEYPDLQLDLKKAIRHEATFNLRQMGSVAGTLVAADGRSPFATALMALDTRLTLMPGEDEFDLGDLLNTRGDVLPRRLILKISLQLKADLSYQYVARSPADFPIVCVAVAKWPSGRLRVVVGGFGENPRLALDAPEPGGVTLAVRSVCAEAEDQWASAHYRTSVAETLASRAIETLNNI
jgi:CO/xanthine dehydrogenase FAD-binding subunit